jgi:transglutaminase-like putative cysteine protease
MRHHCLHFFLRHGALCQTIAGIVLVTFTWLLIYPTALAAQTLGDTPVHTPARESSAEAELAAALQQLLTLLTRLDAKREQGQETQQDEQALVALHARLERLDTQVHANFTRLEQQLKDKGLPDEILQRHTQMVDTYDTEVSTLLTHLRTMEHATEATARSDAGARALRHLQSKQHRRRQQPFDPKNLPFRVPDGTVRKPRETAKEYHSSLVAPKPVMLASTAILPGMLTATQASVLSAIPTPEDLAPTEDAQITDAIKALAADLKHDPVRIYNWVHDNIEFLPTYGSIQGSQMALDNRKGNAFDTASLLIALLRASDIPARYVLGTIQLPIDQVMNWVGGVHVPEAALEVLGQGGIPSTGLVQGGVITAVKLEHVWVEAWVDFEPSRGAVHRQGDTWVPMDASFKQYEYTEGMKLSINVPFNPEAFVTQAAASAQINEAEGWVSGINTNLIQDTLTTYQQQVSSYITSQKANATVSDVIGTKRIVSTPKQLLTATLPYTVVIHGDAMSHLPEGLRHKFRFALYASALDRSFDILVFRVTKNLAQVASKKITLSFVPASQADAEIIVSHLPELPADGSPLDPSAFPTSLPGYLIQLTAELRIDGEIVASGGPFTMGQELISTMGVYDPLDGWQEVDNLPVAGEYQAIAIDAAGISEKQVQSLKARLHTTENNLALKNLPALNKENLLGDLLYGTILLYLASDDSAMQVSAGHTEILSYRRPSFGRFTAVADAQYWFGIPRTVSFPSFEVDIDRLASIIVSKENNKDMQIAYAHQSGLRQSAYEHLIFEWLWTNSTNPGEAFSAVKVLALANATGQRIYHLSHDNYVEALQELQLQNETIAEIRAALESGKMVITHTQPVTISSATVEGYIIFDPVTGSSAYKINGGANGALGVFAGHFSGLILVTMAAQLTPFLFALMLTAFLAFITLMLIEISERGPEGACFMLGFTFGLGTGFFSAGRALTIKIFQDILGLFTATIAAAVFTKLSPSFDEDCVAPDK